MERSNHDDAPSPKMSISYICAGLVDVVSKVGTLGVALAWVVRVGEASRAQVGAWALERPKRLADLDLIFKPTHEPIFLFAFGFRKVGQTK